MIQGEQKTAWVLWHRYTDGSSASVRRVYLTEARAREDHNLLTDTPDGSEWHLDEVPVYGSHYDPGTLRKA